MRLNMKWLSRNHFVVLIPAITLGLIFLLTTLIYMIEYVGELGSQQIAGPVASFTLSCFAFLIYLGVPIAFFKKRKSFSSTSVFLIIVAFVLIAIAFTIVATMQEKIYIKVTKTWPSRGFTPHPWDAFIGRLYPINFSMLTIFGSMIIGGLFCHLNTRAI